MEGHWKFLGGGGVLKAKCLEAMYENKLEFPWVGGGGVQNKKPSVGGVWIFSRTAQWPLTNIDLPFSVTIVLVMHLKVTQWDSKFTNALYFDEL